MHSTSSDSLQESGEVPNYGTGREWNTASTLSTRCCPLSDVEQREDAIGSVSKSSSIDWLQPSFASF
jgi:hypothetical protein